MPDSENANNLKTYTTMKTRTSRSLLISVRAASLAVIAFLCLTIEAFAGQTGEIRGTVIDETGQPVPQVIVKIMTGETMTSNTTTDLDGKYIIKNLNTGTYDLHFQMLGYMTIVRTGINIHPGKTVYINAVMSGVVLDSTEVIAYVPPMVEPEMSTVTMLNTEELQNIATGTLDINQTILAISPEVSEAPDGGIYMRGSRTGSTEYIIDGMKIIGSTDVPGLAISGLMVLTGGVPAEYGDFTGGLIVISTKDYMSGVRMKRVRQFDYNERKAKEKAEELKKKAKEEEEKL